MLVIIDNPDFPMEPPIYEGELSGAIDRLVPGNYPAVSITDTYESIAYGTVTVTDDSVIFVAN